MRVLKDAGGVKNSNYLEPHYFPRLPIVPIMLDHAGVANQSDNSDKTIFHFPWISGLSIIEGNGLCTSGTFLFPAYCTHKCIPAMHSCPGINFCARYNFPSFFLPHSTNFNSKQVFSNQPETIPTAAHIFCPRPIVRTGLFFGSEATRGPGCDPGVARRGQRPVSSPQNLNCEPSCSFLQPCNSFHPGC